MQKTRSPICALLGHVDHGKSSILDKIRGSAIVKGEAGGITQAIGASIIPLETIKKISGKLLDALKMKFTVPGLLFIDTPGHAAFTNLRKRGGNIADIAILVVDINEGFMPQTIEAIEILKHSKTPFIVAANKVDLIQGFREKDGGVLQQVEKQDPKVIGEFEKKMYELVGRLSELGLESERFDRVGDFTKQVAIVPTSAETGLGIPELLMVITGLAQRYLEVCLTCDVTGDARGTILERKEEKGLGTTIDVILYDGHLKVGDEIVIGGIEAPIVTKVKALLEPKPLTEMRDKKSKFKPVKEAVAATGVKISANEIEDAVSGMPVITSRKGDVEKAKKEVQKEVQDVLIETEKEGIVIKADNIGGLEALTQLLKEKNIPIRKAGIGDITKKDIADAESNFDKKPLLSVVLGFNVNSVGGKENVKIFTNEVIYKLIEDLEEWQEKQKKSKEAEEIEGLVRPCKIEIMKGYIFRQSSPAVVGVSIEAGELRTGMPIMNKEGETLTDVKSMQSEQKTVDKAEKGKEVAVSLPKVTVGRQINEGDVLYSSIPEEDFRKLKELKKYLSKEEIEVIKEIAEIKRKENPMWGV